MDDRAEGYRLLDGCLPDVNVDSERSSDFSYQINRPRQSALGIPDLRINRLSRWSVVKRQGFAIHGGVQPAVTIHQEGGLAAKLDLDINTAPDYPSDLQHDRLGDIFQECVGAAVEIAGSGDIP